VLRVLRVIASPSTSKLRSHVHPGSACLMRYTVAYECKTPKQDSTPLSPAPQGPDSAPIVVSCRLVFGDVVL